MNTDRETEIAASTDSRIETGADSQPVNEIRTERTLGRVLLRGCSEKLGQRLPADLSRLKRLAAKKFQAS
jgi:hypothetical protein